MLSMEESSISGSVWAVMSSLQLLWIIALPSSSSYSSYKLLLQLVVFGVGIGLVLKNVFTFTYSTFSAPDCHNQPWWWYNRFAKKCGCCFYVFRPCPKYYFSCDLWGYYGCCFWWSLASSCWRYIKNCALLMLLTRIHPIPAPVMSIINLCCVTMLPPWLAYMCAFSRRILGI